MGEFVIVDKDGYVEKCLSDDVKKVVEHFGMERCTILKIDNGKIEWAHWTYEGVIWKEPRLIDIKKLQKIRV